MSRPDTALRRSDELLAVNQPAAALSSVSEIFSSKRFRSTPLSTLEPILFRFLDLCILLKRGKTAREGLKQYKYVAQNTSETAVEAVIRHFLDKSKEKLDEALAKVDEVAGPADAATDAAATTSKDDGANGTADVEDLEAADTPESILLSAVSEEKSRDRTYRALVTPWLRFLWEAYRTALDILRNNARLEVLYQQVALETFQFCLKHQRKTEFRRLADMLRIHFATAQKYSQQNYAINISDPDTLQRYLDTRFAQLNTAVELELWQEAFRSAEDIHGLVAASKRTPRASVMASFYEKLVKVFAVGQNFLFHAAAYSKLWTLQAATPGAAGTEGDRIAGLVLLSALSVPITAGDEGKFRKNRNAGDERDYTRGRMTLMGLLDLPTAPSRETLLTQALKHGILKSVSPELRELYSIIEVDFHPLHITSKIEPILAHLNASPETQRYVEPLKNVVLSRLFQQLGQVYDSLSLKRVVKLASFKDEVDGEAASSDAAKVRIEKFITDACRRGELSVRLDHNDGIVEFEENLFEVEHQAADVLPTIGPSPHSQNNARTVDLLQPTPSTLLQTHLTHLAQSLYVSLDILSPNHSALAIVKANAEKALQAVAANMAADRDALLSRRLIAEQRKQRAEAEASRKEREAEAARATAKREHELKEARRVEQEARHRQLEQIRKNNEQVKADEAKKLAEKLRSAGALKVADKDIENLDTAALMKIQVEQIEKTRRDMTEKMRIVSKRIDHTERAMRREEIPLLKLDYEIQQKRDREAFEGARAQRIEVLRAAHAQNVQIKARLDTILPDYERFREEKTAAVQAEHKKRLAKAQKKIDEEIEKRRKEVESKREEIRARRRQEEEARRAAEEAERRAREEEEARLEAEEAARAAEEARLAEEKRVQEEAREKRRAEEAERRGRADEQAAKQRAREEEVERRLAEKEAARRAQPPARAPVPGSAGWRPAESAAATAAPSGERPRVPGVAPGSWREREAARKAAGDGSSAAPAPPASSGPPSRTATPPVPSANTAAPSGERPRFNLQPKSEARIDSRPPSQTREASSGPPPASNGNGDADGFQTVAPVKKTGTYRPPGARSDGAKRW